LSISFTVLHACRAHKRHNITQVRFPVTFRRDDRALPELSRKQVLRLGHHPSTDVSLCLYPNPHINRTTSFAMVLSLPKQRSKAAFAGFALACLIQGSQSLLRASPSPHSQVRNIASSRTDKTMCLFSKKENENDEPAFEVKTWNPLRLLVLRLGLTEPMATSPLNYGKYDGGKFSCAYCDQEIFDGNAKYDSGSGWPSFWRSTEDGKVKYKREMDGRLECQCARCSSHLGHVFMDGPRPTEVPEELYLASPASDPRTKTATYLPRFCLNGASLTYKKGESSGNVEN
jgi:peptide-methionine (R)-S-oxide reductase